MTYNMRPMEKKHCSLIKAPSNKKLLKEYHQKRHSEPAEYKKFSGKCHTCGRMGHIARYCRSKTNNAGTRSYKEDATTAIALNTGLSK
ncbi:hypothetical protein WH47_01050 [Habropoda laboriosa]|uniref:CCHC-type domain-containing protein n=1 Tax=Habropoda laboriosa TaxID=597456 RepID=A0A0L7R0Z5_9HYME|nr:hypothetical protein WH47_01050 [Habropoda laboriosa]